jgi:hypothetical protein
MISPDPKTEDTEKDLDLWAVTKKTMAYLEERFNREIVFVAAEHAADHTDKKHVHSVVLLRWKERLYVPELEALIKRATEASLSQRRDRDLLQQGQREQQAKQRSTDLQTTRNHPIIGMVGGECKAYPRAASPRTFPSCLSKLRGRPGDEAISQRVCLSELRVQTGAKTRLAYGVRSVI